MVPVYGTPRKIEAAFPKTSCKCDILQYTDQDFSQSQIQIQLLFQQRRGVRTTWNFETIHK